MEMLRIEEVARRLGIKKSTVRFWIWSGKIQYVKIGRSVRISDEVVDSIIAHGTVYALPKE